MKIEIPSKKMVKDIVEKEIRNSLNEIMRRIQAIEIRLGIIDNRSK